VKRKLEWLDSHQTRKTWWGECIIELNIGIENLWLKFINANLVTYSEVAAPGASRWALAVSDEEMASWLARVALVGENALEGASPVDTKEDVG